MEGRRGEDLRGEFKRGERGWCLGGEEFRQELLEQVEARPRPSHVGEAVQEAEAAQAERLVVKGLKRMRWSVAHLSARRKGAPRKVQVSQGVALQDHHALGLDRGALERGQPRASEFGVRLPCLSF